MWYTFYLTSQFRVLLFNFPSFTSRIKFRGKRKRCFKYVFVFSSSHFTKPKPLLGRCSSSILLWTTPIFSFLEDIHSILERVLDNLNRYILVKRKHRNKPTAVDGNESVWIAQLVKSAETYSSGTELAAVQPNLLHSVLASCGALWM